MSSKTEFVCKVEADLRNTHKIGNETSEAFASLSPATRTAFQQSMGFLGLELPAGSAPSRTDQQDRVDAAALMFLYLYIDTHDPKWSSWLLEKLLDAVLKTPNGEIIDLFRGFDLALEEYQVRLTETVVNLVKEVVVLSFTKARAAYQQANWEWANEKLTKGVSPARCYLFLHALPPEKATAAAIVAILRGLADTPYSIQAIDVLSDDLGRADVKPLLRELQPKQSEVIEKLRPYL